MGIKHGRGWGGARISLSRGSVLSREYFPSSFVMYFTISAEIMQIFQNAKKTLDADLQFIQPLVLSFQSYNDACPR